MCWVRRDWRALEQVRWKRLCAGSQTNWAYAGLRGGCFHWQMGWQMKHHMGAHVHTTTRWDVTGAAYGTAVAGLRLGPGSLHTAEDSLPGYPLAVLPLLCHQSC